MIMSVFTKRCGYVILITAALIMTACNNKSANGGAVGSADSVTMDSVVTEVSREVGVDSLKTDTVSYDK